MLTLCIFNHLTDFNTNTDDGGTLITESPTTVITQPTISTSIYGNSNSGKKMICSIVFINTYISMYTYVSKCKYCWFSTI